MKTKIKGQNLTKIKNPIRINIFRLNKKFSVKEKIIKNLVYKILRGEECNIKEINVIFADNRLLKDLNKRFLKKNRPTNVISFNLNNIAEIYISPQRAKDKQELLFFLAHGLLHICGYDHKNPRAERLMERSCLQYLKNERLC